MYKQQHRLDNIPNRELKELLREVYDCAEPRESDFEALLDELYSRITTEAYRASFYRRKADTLQHKLEEMECQINP